MAWKRFAGCHHLSRCCIAGRPGGLTINPLAQSFSRWRSPAFPELKYRSLGAFDRRLVDCRNSYLHSLVSTRLVFCTFGLGLGAFGWVTPGGWAGDTARQALGLAHSNPAGPDWY